MLKISYYQILQWDLVALALSTLKIIFHIVLLLIIFENNYVSTFNTFSKQYNDFFKDNSSPIGSLSSVPIKIFK